MGKTPARRVKQPPPDPAQVATVKEWLLQGQSANNIVEAVRATYPGVEPSTLIVASMMEFKRASNFDSDVLRGFCLEGFREALRRSFEANDIPSAIRALKEIGRMAYVYDQRQTDEEEAPDQIEASTKDAD